MLGQAKPKPLLPLVSAVGTTSGVSLAVSVGVAVVMIIGVTTVFGEISGEKTLPLLVIFLVSVMLPISGSISLATSFVTAN